MEMMEPSVQHQQDIMASQSLESMLVCTKPQSESQQPHEKKPRPAEQAMKCPRCDSTNTKFCYYNNYSLTQPRYFCKSCRRYWTKGGTLRNVPVGGGCRKNKRSSSSASRRCTPDHHITTTPTSSSSITSSPLFTHLNSSYDHHDLTLAFARLQENHGNIPLLALNPGGGSSHFDLFGNSYLDQQNHHASSVLSHPLYYGNLGNVENSGGTSANVSSRDDHRQFDHHSQESMSNASSGASTPTTFKQELMGEGRVLWGLPWQLSAGAETNYMGVNGGSDTELVRESWNSAAVLGSSWHTLVNSPLM